MTAYYNEFDPYAAAWLRNLIAAGLIADGEVDDRSILDVRADDLRGFDQCHFFAGIGGWSYALRLAGWPDERPVWTGSCPCQPFSVAGQGKGEADARDLWPVWSALIRECRPPVVLGEQVAAAIGMHWLDRSRVDLEGAGYAFGSAVLPACAVGAPHRRDRLWFVADADGSRPGAGRRDDGEGGRVSEAERRAEHGATLPWRGGGAELGPLADADEQHAHGRGNVGPRGRDEPANGSGTLADADRLGGQVDQDAGRRAERGGAGSLAGPRGARDGDVADADQPGPQGRQLHPERRGERSPWSDGVAWLTGADGKARRVEPGIRLLAHGVPARVGKLRAYGNAIVPQVAAAFIEAYLDCARDVGI